MEPLKLADIQNSLLNCRPQLLSTHMRLSFPIVLRIYKKMQAGIKFSPIKVDGDLICDGHHRYVAALLANFPIEKIAWQSSSATTAISWSEVYYDENDWDTAFEVKMRNIQDATYNDLTLDQIEDLLK